MPDCSCPGYRLVYTCSTSGGVLVWRVGETEYRYIQSRDNVGDNKTDPGVRVVLTENDESGLKSTLTILSAGSDVANESTISCAEMGSNYSSVLCIIGE